jgi:hypothetical protein
MRSDNRIQQWLDNVHAAQYRVVRQGRPIAQRPYILGENWTDFGDHHTDYATEIDIA